jgi:hypothetical protein
VEPYLFYFLFVLSDLKSYGCIKYSSTKPFGTLKSMEQFPRILISKSQIVLACPSLNIGPPPFYYETFLHLLFILGIFKATWVYNTSWKSKGNLRMSKGFNKSNTLSVESQPYLP